MAAGIAPAVIWTLQAHGCEKSAAWSGCGALLALACEPVHCVTLMQLGAAKHATTALRLHLEDVATAWAACGIIVKLAARRRRERSGSCAADPRQRSPCRKGCLRCVASTGIASKQSAVASRTRCSGCCS